MITKFRFTAEVIEQPFHDSEGKKGDVNNFSLSFTEKEYQADGFSLMREARQHVENYFDMSCAWVVDRDCHAESLDRLSDKKLLEEMGVI